MRQTKGYWRARAEVHELAIDFLSGELDAARERIKVLEGREWQRYEHGERPMPAMPSPGPDPDDGYVWLSDDTGIVRERVRRDDLPDAE